MDLILYLVMIVVGFLIGVAVDRYFLKKKYDGNLEVSAKDTSQIFQFEIMTEPEKLQTQKSVTFRVKKVAEE